MMRGMMANVKRYAELGDWRLGGLVFGISLVALLVGYWSTVKSLVWVWGHDGTYEYAFLIVPLSLWSVFELRHKLATTTPRPTIWAVPVIAILVVIWLLGRISTINLAQHFAFVAMLPALTLAIFGWRVVWILKFPLAYLAFAIPWGSSLVGPLQDVTARFAVRALELTGSPVLLNGREIITPVAVWMVENACSGVRFFIACTALGCLFAFLMYRRWWKRVLFVVLSSATPVVANGLRVYFEVLIGEHWGLKYATGTDHMIFGWQFFGSVLILLFLVGWFFRDADATTHEDLPEQRDAAPAMKLLTARNSLFWGVALAVVISGPIADAQIRLPADSRVSAHIEAPVLAGWRGPRAGQSDWRPKYVGANGKVFATYRRVADNQELNLYHALYLGRPERGHDLVTYGNELHGPGARVLAAGQRDLHLSNGRRFGVRTLRLSKAGRSRLVWYWYCINDRCTESAVVAKLLQVWGVVRRVRVCSSVWAVSTVDSASGSSNPRADLAAFTRAIRRSSATDSSVKSVCEDGLRTGKITSGRSDHATREGSTE